MRIRIDKSKETPEVLASLKAVFQAYHGKTAVYLHLTGNGRVIKTEPAYWVTPSPAAKDAIEQVIGKATVTMA